jgi:CRAL/TRIO domain
MTTITPFGNINWSYEERWHPDQVKECIDFWCLSPEETKKLHQLQERLSSDDDLHLKHYWGNGPFEMVRFVREHSCHGNVNGMEKRVRKCVEWREHNHLDNILETFSPTILAFRFPAAIMQGLDHEGDGLVVIRQGDPLGLLHRFGVDEVVRSLLWGLEFAIRGPWQQQLAQRPKMVTAVIDLKGLNSRHYHPSLLQIVQKMGFALQLHYPHIVKRVLVVNAPGIFRFVWTIVKPFVMPHLRMLMEVASESETEELLQKYVNLCDLPEVLAPGIGKGRPVHGLNPDWTGGLLPPKQDSDWDRIPLVYGPSSEHERVSKEHQSTVSLTASMASSFDSERKFLGKSCNRHPMKSKGKPLFKGQWVESLNGHTRIQFNS